MLLLLGSENLEFGRKQRIEDHGKLELVYEASNLED
jgi:hypothetical protein